MWCDHKPNWQIGLKIWALSTPRLLRDDGNCVKMLSSLTCCDECRSKVKAQDLLLPEGRERIATGLARAGRAMPDFDNAALDFVEVIDEPIDVTKLPPGADVINA